ncbi:MAG TPA: hypothetical protein PLV42_12445 [bacterium]|nr:hypothetical protein [bacterium]
MKYTVILFVLIFYRVASAEDISNLALDPGHGHLNNAGAIELSFDLPAPGDIEAAYLEINIGGTTSIVPGSEIDGEDLTATGNTLTLKGTDLYELAGGASTMWQPLAGPDALATDEGELLIDSDPELTDSDAAADPDATIIDTDEDASSSDNEVPDEDAIDGDEWPSERDGQYTINLVVVVDHDTMTDADTDTDTDIDNDSDQPDADIMTIRTPLYGTGVESRESFRVTLDNVPPQAPLDAVTEGGNKKLIVTVTPPTKDATGKSGELVGGYHVQVSGRFLSEGIETLSSLEYLVTVSEDERDDDTVTLTIEGKDGYSIINNDTGDDTYEYTIRIWAEDLAGNTDASRYIETTGSALTTEGFWSHYKSAGGAEDGGYCFIATVGYGSYTHPHVRVLRAWRDAFLATNSTGQKFVSLYYHNGPRLAAWVTTVPFGQPAVQLLLFPLVVFAWLMLHPLLLSLLVAIYLIPLRRFMTCRRAVVFLPILLALILPPSLQAAEEEQEEEEGKKKEEKTEIHGDLFFAGGFYDPSNIDKSANGSPFAEIASDDLNFMPTLHGGIDIPAGKYLKLTPHAGIGFVELKGRSLRLDGTAGAERTYLYVLPLMAEVKLRPVYEFPVRPYIAGGFDYYIWWIIEDGHLAMDGGKFGFHGSAGIQISLNFIDPKTAIKLREATGILDTSLFAHYRLEQVDNFGDNNSFDLSSSRFEFGILFDF